MMIEPISILFAGVAAGGVHALSGPDHLAAVAPLSISHRHRAAWIGILWGLGHAAGVAAIGVVVFGLRRILNLEMLSAWSERGVGLMLIAVGIWGLRKALTTWVHTHEHRHGTDTHSHLHVHPPHQSHPEHTSHDKHTHASLGMGLLHGVAGTSHLFGVLPALALPSQLAAALYLGGYGAGNLFAMGGFAWLIGLAAGRASGWGAQPFRVALGMCSAASIGIGIFWLIF